MNDYLNNLIVRTLQLAPVVRPRLPSLFEPLSATAEHAVSASSSNEIISETQTSQRSTPEVAQSQSLVERPTQPSKPVASEADKGTVTPETREASTVEKLGPPQNLIPRRDEPITPAAQVLTPAQLPAKTPEARSIREAAKKTAQSSDAQSGADSSADEQEVYKLSETPLKVADRSPAETTSPARGDIVETDIVETTSMRTLASRVVRSTARRDDARLFPTYDEVAPFRSPEPPQTISVTIGRVEVRAVFPQQQSKPPRRAHPAPMSLDEYTKQQNEGRK